MAIAPRMEPEWSTDTSAETQPYMRVLLMGAPKIGKSTAAIGTSPGPVYVILSDEKYSLVPVRRIHPNAKFAKNLVHSREKMEDALKVAHNLVAEGKIKTVVWDTMNDFATRLEDECARATMNDKGEADGRRYWPVYTKYITNTLGRLFKLDAHIIVLSHWTYLGESDDMAGGVPKTGTGIVPQLGRQLRATIGRKFDDVLFMDKVPKVGRAFVTGIEGVWGPGCRNIDGNKTLAPSFVDFMREAGFTTSKAKK